MNFKVIDKYFLTEAMRMGAIEEHLDNRVVHTFEDIHLKCGEPVHSCCISIFDWLKDRTVKDYIGTILNRCHRPKEGKDHFEYDIFTMREMVWAGNHKLNDSVFNRVMEWLKFDEFLPNSRIVRAEDFFIEAGKHDPHQLKYELQSYIDSQWIAIASVNMHGTFLSEKYDIKLEDGNHAFTGCFGIGYERLAHAYLAEAKRLELQGI